MKKTDKQSLSFSDFNSVKISIASADDILNWSHGEVLKQETLNYRTQKPEKDGLFCERIFGPTQNINPYDSRLKGVRVRLAAVDKSGALVTKAVARRERMGHIKLMVPVVHTWFLNRTPSSAILQLQIPQIPLLTIITRIKSKILKKITYFESYLILQVNEKMLEKLTEDLKHGYEEARLMLNQAATFSKKDLEWDSKLESGQVLEAGQVIGKSKTAKKDVSLDYPARLIINAKNLEAYPLELEQVLAKLKINFEIDPDKILSLRDLRDKLDYDYQLQEKKLKDVRKYGAISEIDFQKLKRHYSDINLNDLMTVEMGGEAIQKMLSQIDLDKMIDELKAEIKAREDKLKQKEVSKHQLSQKQKARYRDNLIRLRVLQNIKDAQIVLPDLCIGVLPVIPPDLRPITQLQGGRFASSDLNDLYRRVINRNNRLKRLISLKAPELICRNEKRMLQEAVDALIDNNSSLNSRSVVTGSQNRPLKSLTDILYTKKSRFKNNLLGKRTDYSARSVIVVGSDLKIHECGLPKKIGLEIFKPFIISYIIENGYVHNIRLATRLIEAGDTIVWDALDQIIEGKYVILNRQPSLHRLSTLAFQPKLVEGNAIQLHPLVLKGFNADFDGDQMAVYLPLSQKAQDEAKSLMAADLNLVSPSNGSLIISLDQDMIMGLYYLTYDRYPDQEAKHLFSSVDEAILALENGTIQLQTPIRIKFRDKIRETNLGRIKLNEILPDDFPFQNVTLDKDNIKRIVNLIHRLYENSQTAVIVDSIKNLAFQQATRSGISVGVCDLELLIGNDKINQAGINNVLEIQKQFGLGLMTPEEKRRLILDNWYKINSQIQAEVKDYLTKIDNSLNLIVDSQARGRISVDYIKQMTASIGIQTDTAGKILELYVTDNYVKGLSNLQYFTTARNSRKSIADVAFKTPNSGYLTRRLVYIMQDIVSVTDDEVIDPGFPVYKHESEELGISLGNRTKGRYAAKDIFIANKRALAAGELIDEDIADQIDQSDLEVIYIMSSLSTPHLKGVPSKSYGLDLTTRKLVEPNSPIGIIAAQSICEPSTQLNLDSKHARGSASSKAIYVNTGLERMKELIELPHHTPTGEGYLADFDGKITIEELSNSQKLILTAPDKDIIKVPSKDLIVKVKDGQTIEEYDAYKDENLKPGTYRQLPQTLLAVTKNHEAVMSPASGKIKLTSSAIEIHPPGRRIKTYNIPKYIDLLVENNQAVKKGDRLTEGSLYIPNILKLKGVIEAQRYLLFEISQVFASEGILIDDKHLEILVRKMFSRVEVVDRGDSHFIEGDCVSQEVFATTNYELVKNKLQPAVYKPIILNIKQLNHSSDSFLMNVCFEDRAKGLISFAMSGTVDNLSGLIENALIGRQIPVGSGYYEAGSGSEEERGKALDDQDIDDIEVKSVLDEIEQPVDKSVKLT